MLDRFIYAKTLEGIKMTYRIDDEVVNEIKDRANIVDFISQYVDLKKSGSGYVGLCPFHHEKTPSFHVKEKEGYYYCFGCHATGDIFTFMMDHNHMTFVEAAEELAKRYGVELKEQNKFQEEERLYFDTLYKINREAGLYYMKNLSREKGPLIYLENRGIDKDLILKYGLGYAGPGKKDLCDHLLALGYKLNEIEDCNLAYKNQDTGKPVDRFRNRIIFPIINTRGRVIGFGGRQFDSDYGPKYLNSRDTPIFHKGKNLYGLHIINQKKDRDRIILVEGYMDVISLGKVGIFDAVASLGTALTPDQGNLLKRNGLEVYICYDGDEAGIKATKRAIHILFSVGLKPKIISLKDGMDPDDFIQKEGPDAFELEVKRAKDPIEYLIEQMEENFTLTSTQGKVHFLKEVAKLLSGIQSPVERDIYIDQVARKYGANRESLRIEIEAAGVGVKNVEKTPRVQVRQDRNLMNNVVQRTLLRMVLADEKMLDFLEDKEIFWGNAGYERAFEEIKNQGKDQFPLDVDGMIDKFIEKKYFSKEEAYFLKQVKVNATMNETLVKETLEKLKMSYLKRRRQELIQAMDDAENQGKDNLDDLIKEFNHLNDQII